MVIALFLIITFIATTVHTCASFGFGIITIMTYPLLLNNYPVATVCVTAFALVFSTVNAWHLRKNIVWSWITPTFVGFFPACIFAVRLLNVIDEHAMRHYLGIVLMVLSLYFIFFQKRIQMQPTKLNGFIVGVLGGVLESMFCVGGPPIVLYLLTVSKDVPRYTATVQAWFALLEAYILLNRYINGMVTPMAIHYISIGIFAVIPGIILGQKLLTKMNPQILKNIVYGIMLVYGFILTFLQS